MKRSIKKTPPPHSRLKPCAFRRLQYLAGVKYIAMKKIIAFLNDESLIPYCIVPTIEQSITFAILSGRTTIKLKDVALSWKNVTNRILFLPKAENISYKYRLPITSPKKKKNKKYNNENGTKKNRGELAGELIRKFQKDYTNQIILAIPNMQMSKIVTSIVYDINPKVRVARDVIFNLKVSLSELIISIMVKAQNIANNHRQSQNNSRVLLRDVEVAFQNIFPKYQTKKKI